MNKQLEAVAWAIRKQDVEPVSRVTGLGRTDYRKAKAAIQALIDVDWEVTFSSPDDLKKCLPGLRKAKDMLQQMKQGE